MRKKQLVAIVGLAVLFVLIIIVTQAVGKKAATNALCKNLILNIEKGDAPGTYAKLSDSMHQQVDANTWASYVRSLRGSYGETVPELQNRTVKKDPITQKNFTEETYKINNGSGPYTATCQISNTGKGEQIDAFASKVID